MSANIEIIIGTYEEFLLGYKFDIKNETPTLTQSFADKSHSGSIRSVAVQERWVASGGTDDRIFIYDMSTRKQSQILLSHEGTVNALSFTPDGTHLLTGGEDGRMIATRLKTWFVDATWKKAHNGAAVTHISCHPSGKLALSLGSDLVLRTWNLVKGRVAYKTNLKSRNTLGAQPDCLAWSPTGDYFTITGQRVIEFWSIKTADVVRSHKTKSKPICLTWITDDSCLVGLEDGKILWLSTDSEEEKEIVAHNARVKAMCVFKQNLVSASSSGEIKLWQINENKQKLKELATTNIGCRPTCIIILDLDQFGANYVISNTLGAKDIDIKPTTSKPKAPQRGVVTIEYDNEDEEEEDADSNNDEDTENEADSVAEEDDEGADNKDDGIEEDDDDEEDDEDDNDDDEDSEDSDDSNPEPEIRLPKSRKHKLQIVKRKEDEKKKLKLDNQNKQQVKKQKQQQQSQQKKSKQKLKK
ncbi:p21-activated protein kinase-interacting protein 1-like [Lucilia cuprina]|uniref:p21-activated protein kinase-interacting protein 1-like n=1 Tax=Lucilia cuprina TaxID=7375 RepID=UPI001F067331|nr:p21-activated protein kinase-interacting protein 1-like [Lucilia cuprina]